MVSHGTTTRELRELLVPTHLHYDAGTASLRTRALAEMLTKVLFSLPEHRAHIRALSREVAHLAHVKKIGTDDVRVGLVFLLGRGIVHEEKENRWSLSDDGVEKIQEDIETARKKTEAILDNYFGTKIERDILRQWFRYAAAHFFGVYSDLWARILYKRDLGSAPSQATLKETLHASIKRYGLSEHADEIINGFRAFIDNYKDPLVTEQIWHFAQAMLSARLVTASIGPDPITVNEFRGAKIFLDTNTLFLASLEDERTADAFAELTKSLKEIGTTLHMLPHTEREYERVITHKKTEICKVADCFPIETLAETRDPFLKAALLRGAKNSESIRAFFETIADPLEQFANHAADIVLETGADIHAAADMAAQDGKRRTEIAAEWSKCHSVPKTRNSVIHDAALDGAVELLRKRGEKAWVLTRDTSMQTLSNRWTGSENVPVWLSVDALMSILAVESTGPSHDPTQYAPLLRSLIEAEMQPSEAAYQIEDLSELIDLEERVKELDANEIKIFANKIARLRMLGKPKADGELQLEIRRTFNRTKTGHSEKIKTLQEELVKRDEAHEEVLLANETAHRALVSVLFRRFFLKEILLLGSATLGLLLVGAALILLGLRLPLAEHPILVPVLISLGVTEILIPAARWIIPSIKSARKKAYTRAEQKADMLMCTVKENEKRYSVQ